MAYTTINKGSSYFNTVLYTGNGATQSITGVGFKPDFVWLKSRNNTYYHNLYDVVRGFSSGNGRVVFTNDTLAEDANAGLTSFNTDGFSLGSEVGQNGNGTTYASWNWLASNTTVSNTSGTITSTVSANTTSGFSIVSYTGNGTGGATIGHGLGVTPTFIIVKKRSSTGNWPIYAKQANSGAGQNGGIYLNLSNAFSVDANFWNSTSATSSVFTVGAGGDVNASGATFIAYCFTDIKGFSKFGSYTGNGNTSGNGTFVYLGFKPKFIMIKRSDTAGFGWYMRDTARDTYNVGQNYLDASSSSAEGSGTPAYLDYLSNGFKLTNTSASDGINASGGTYIYMAFAENPFVSSTQVPTTAR